MVMRMTRGISRPYVRLVNMQFTEMKDGSVLMPKGKKMRLIDADAYLERMKKDPLFDLIEGYGFSGTLLAEPTVEAIPIEWLNSFKRLLVKEARQAIDEAISQWNGDEEIIEETER